MTSKERIIATLKREKIDHVSIFPSIDLCYGAAQAGKTIGECFCSPEVHARALQNALDIHPDLDGVYVNLCLDKALCEKTEDDLYRDGGGMYWKVPDNDVGTVVNHDIINFWDERIENQDPLRDGIINTFKLIGQEYKEKYYIVPGLTGPYSHLVFMMGMQKLMYAMIDIPQQVHEALKHRTKLALSWADELHSLGAEMVWIGEGAASSSIISPKMYSEFVLPYIKPVVDRLREYSIKTIMHVCGDVNASVREIVKTGADIIDVDYMVEMEKVRAVGKKVCTKGNIDPTKLLYASEKEVEEMVHLLLENNTESTILGTGCLVTRDTPKRNIDAIIKAVYSYQV